MTEKILLHVCVCGGGLGGGGDWAGIISCVKGVTHNWAGIILC